MTAAVVLAQARNAGLHHSAHGNRLRMRRRRPSTALLDGLVKHKAELLLMLGPAEGATTSLELIRAAVACWPDARRELWDERAAIIQYFGCESRKLQNGAPAIRQCREIQPEIQHVSLGPHLDLLTET